MREGQRGGKKSCGEEKQRDKYKYNRSGWREREQNAGFGIQMSLSHAE